MRAACERDRAVRRPAQDAINDLEDQIVAVRKELVRLRHHNGDAAASQNRALATGRACREQIAFLQGRVSQELERGFNLPVV